MLKDLVIAMSAAVMAGVVLSGLAWIAAKTSDIRTTLEHKPWMLAGLIGFASAAVSLGATLGLSTLFYPELKVRIAFDPSTTVGNSKSFGPVSDNKVCMISTIDKHHGDGDGHAILDIESDTWQAQAEGSPGSTLGAKVICYKITLSR